MNVNFAEIYEKVLAWEYFTPVMAGTAGLILFWLFVRWMLGQGKKERPVDESQSYGGVFGPLTEPIAAQWPESEQENEEFALLLTQAGMYSPSARDSVYALRVVFLLIPLIITAALLLIFPADFTFYFLIGGGIAGAVCSTIPRLYVWQTATTRCEEIRRGLPDMMDMISMCMQGGMPLSDSLYHVAKHLRNHPALSEELHIVRKQAEVGSLVPALNDFAARTDLPEVRQATSLMARSEQLGTQLSGSLNDQADHVRNTRKQLATQEANQAPVKLVFPLLLCFAPAALILLMSPAALELREFFSPENENNPLLENNTIDTASSIRQTLDTAQEENLSLSAITNGE